MANLSVEGKILLLTVFSMVFGASLYFQAAITAFRKKKSETELPSSSRLIDWMIVIIITGVLVYLLR